LPFPFSLPQLTGLPEVYTTDTLEVITFYLTLREVLGNKSVEYCRHRTDTGQERSDDHGETDPYPPAVAKADTLVERTCHADYGYQRLAHL
jgi:hypothetical protein